MPGATTRSQGGTFVSLRKNVGAVYYLSESLTESRADSRSETKTRAESLSVCCAHRHVKNDGQKKTPLHPTTRSDPAPTEQMENKCLQEIINQRAEEPSIINQFAIPSLGVPLVRVHTNALQSHTLTNKHTHMLHSSIAAEF